MTYTIDSTSLRKDQSLDNRYHLRIEWSAHGRHATFSKVIDCSEDHVKWALANGDVVKRLAPEFFSTVEHEIGRMECIQ